MSGIHEAVLLIVFRRIRVVLCDGHFCLLTSKDDKYVAFIFVRKPICKSSIALLINLWLPRYRNCLLNLFRGGFKTYLMTSLSNICTMLSCCVFMVKLSTSYNAIKVLYVYCFLQILTRWIQLANICFMSQFQPKELIF